VNAARVAAALRELAAAIEDGEAEKRPRKRADRRPPPPSSEPTEKDLAEADRILRAKGWNHG
jgi:hypothetical protein